MNEKREGASEMKDFPNLGGQTQAGTQSCPREAQGHGRGALEGCKALPRDACDMCCLGSASVLQRDVSFQVASRR